MVASRAGSVVRATTAAGRPALDLVAGVTSQLHRLGVEDVHDVGVCTACSPRHFSFRARGDLARQAGVVWVP
jgi:copper oxidase (laccase) domain-containing protein